MTKLHELLAAEGNLETQAIQTRTDLAATFEKKRHIFEEKHSTLISKVEGEPAKTEVQSSMSSSVRGELEWITPHLAKAMDAGLQVADANTKARADVVLDDDSATVLLKNIPATALLELEKRLTEWVLQLAKTIPTLDSAKGFARDEAKAKHAYKAREVTKDKTKKETKPIVKYAHTTEHPAQTELITVDTVVGTIQEQEWSSLITPGEKSEIIDRAEVVIRAVKQARSRANDQEVDTKLKLGKTLLNFVFDGKKP